MPKVIEVEKERQLKTMGKAEGGEPLEKEGEMRGKESQPLEVRGERMRSK